jgi:hypothetical protein
LLHNKNPIPIRNRFHIALIPLPHEGTIELIYPDKIRAES